MVAAGALAEHHDSFPSIDLPSPHIGLSVQHISGGPRGPVSLAVSSFILLVGAAMTFVRPDRLR